MNIFTKYFLVLFGAGVLTYILTPLFRKLAWSIGLIAEPGGRRIHVKSTPLTGGIALFLGMHLACVPIFCCSYWGELDGHMNAHWWFVLVALSSVLLLLGVLDDKLELRASVKFIGQVAVAIAAYFSGVHIGTLSGIELHPVLDMLLTVFWFVGFMNAFNLIDGMDGLAAGLGAIAATGMAAIFIFRGYPSNTLIMLALAGGCLAFLRYNFSPATIFLGDSGSMFIGFTLAFVALLTNSKSTTLAAIGIPMLAIGVPILDTLLAVWRRSIRARLSDGGDEGKISQGDSDHLHHRLARRGFTQRRVVIGLYILNLAFVLVGVSLTVFKSHSLGILLIAFVAGTYVLVRHLAYVEFRDSGKLLAEGMSRSISRIVAVIIYIPLDIIIMMSLSLISVIVSHPQEVFAWNRVKHLWIQHLPLYVAVPFLILCVGRTYRTVWSRARVTEYVRLAFELLAGILVAFGIYSFFDSEHLGRHFLSMLIYVTLLIPSLVILRALWRIVQDVMRWLNPKGMGEKSTPLRTIVIGADKESILYLNANAGNRYGNKALVQVITILDEDSNLHRRYVHGIKVRGGLNILRETVRQEKIRQIVLTVDLDDEQQAQVMAVAKEENVPLIRSKMVLEKL